MPGIHYRDARGPDGVVVYAIGDVHGRLDLLSAMHEAIARDRDRRNARDWRIIHLGDLVDRGPDSRGVLDFLIEAGRDERVISLGGNHDAGFLDFLAMPDANGLFARFGGVQTARSYGVELDFGSASSLLRSHAELLRAVPAAHVEFLRSLASCVSFGDFFFCHAGIRPGVLLERQELRDLSWIREPFLGHSGLHPKVVVHGHTPASEPEVLGNRVNIDTGAFMTGRLTALVVDGAEKQVFSVSE